MKENNILLTAKNFKQILDIKTNLLMFLPRPFFNKNSYNFFAKIHFIDYEILDINHNLLIERTSIHLGYNTFFLIIVYPQYEEIKTEKIKSDFYPHCEINVIHTSFEELFSSGLMHKIYLENENSTLSFRTIINFRGWTYKALQIIFKTKNIIIQSQNKHTTHTLNPSTHRFSQFVSVFEGTGLEGVIKSFFNGKRY
jgi:hypothetical protein